MKYVRRTKHERHSPSIFPRKILMKVPEKEKKKEREHGLRKRQCDVFKLRIRTIIPRAVGVFFKFFELFVSGRERKITALLVLKCNSDGSDPVVLANASDVTRFGYFQRPSVRGFIVFFGRTVAKRTPPGQRQSVQHEEYKVHWYNRNGFCAVAFMDDNYPFRSAFSVLNQVPDEYQKNFGDACGTMQMSLSHGPI